MEIPISLIRSTGSARWGNAFSPFFHRSKLALRRQTENTERGTPEACHV